MVNETIEELHDQLDKFDKTLGTSLKTPQELEKNLSKLESMVAVLTRGWRGSEQGDLARGVYKTICIRLRLVFFALRELKDIMQGDATDPKVVEALKVIVKDDKALTKRVSQVFSSRRKAVEGYDDLVTEYWDAVKQRIFVLFHSVVKTGIENRIRKEADEEAAREMAKMKNPSYGLAKILESGDIEQGRYKPD